MKAAAIDVGSNSIKLVVVEAAASDSFAVLTRDKDPVRLGHYTLRNRNFSQTAIEKAAVCIKRFRSIAEARGAERIFAVATAAVREARNSQSFVKEIAARTGLQISILSPIEEARLIGVAASHACAARGTTIINIDIGGGSTELSVMLEGTPLNLLSVQIGAVGLTDRLITSDPIKPKELQVLREEIRAALERPSRELRGARWQQATGTSGTILSIGEALRLRTLTAEQRNAEGAQPAGDDVSLGKLIAFNSHMSSLTLAERRAVPGISNQRAEIIVAGGLILEGAMRAFGINLLRTCSWALREGVLIDRLQEIETESQPPRADVVDYRLRGVHAVGHRYGYEETHAQQVAAVAESIFDQIATYHPAAHLTRHHRTLLSAAALLHDIGYHIAHENHHKHALYLIKNSELTGFSEAERAVIANVARYHRGPMPRNRHDDFMALNETDRETVRALAAIVRLADALDRSQDGRVEKVQCAIDPQNIQIQIHCARDCAGEIFAAEQKRELLEQVFGRRVSFSRRYLRKRA